MCFSLNDMIKHKATDERQQKTNLVTFYDFDFDSILLGNSRVTYINQNNFKYTKTFNYSVSAMLPEEYNDYIEYAKFKNKKAFETIFIGVDFMGSNKVLHYRDTLIFGNKYIENSNSLFYRLKLLFGIDTLRYAMRDLALTLKCKSDCVDENYYTNNIRYHVKSTEYIKDANISQIERFEYNYKDLTDEWKKLKKNNPKSRFVFFITPAYATYYYKNILNGNIDAYGKWLHTIVDNFGSVWDFSNLNNVTIDKNNFTDGSHFYPYIGTQIVETITNGKVKDNFGVLIDKDNIDEYVIDLNNSLPKPISIKNDFSKNHYKGNF